jgi:hypothetical protein
MSRADTANPDTFEAASNVENAAPQTRKKAVRAILVAKSIAQNVKKASAVALRPVNQ